MQLDDNNVGSPLKAKETNQKPSANHAKSQGLEYHQLCQQWDHLVAQEGVLWRYYAQPRGKARVAATCCATRPPSKDLRSVSSGSRQWLSGYNKTLID